MVESLSIQLLVDTIRRSGPVSFSVFQEAALIGPDGFYTRGGGAGRRRDFLTSPEVGGLFGAVLARSLDAEWIRLGRPDPFVVIECGAGPGTLARTVLAAAPSCLGALRYVLVDGSAAMATAQREHLALDPPSVAFGEIPRTGPRGEEIDDFERVPSAHQGPVLASLSAMPAGRFCGVVLANELVDNLPIDIAQRSAHGWDEVRVGLGGARLVEVITAASPALAALGVRFAPDAPVGGRVPIQRAAQAWLREALDVLWAGRVVVVDYARATTAQFGDLPQAGWMRTYGGHVKGRDVFETPGSRDITCDVAVDQLACVRTPTRVRSQAEYLRAYGIEELVAQAREYWDEHAAVGDLAAVRARSRVAEAAALLDPVGLGGFTVLEWVV